MIIREYFIKQNRLIWVEVAVQTVRYLLSVVFASWMLLVKSFTIDPLLFHTKQTYPEVQQAVNYRTVSIFSALHWSIFNPLLALCHTFS